MTLTDEERRERDRGYRRARMADPVRARRNRETSRAWREENREHRREYARAYDEAHRERRREQNRIWREANRGRELAAQRERSRRRQSDPEVRARARGAARAYAEAATAATADAPRRNARWTPEEDVLVARADLTTLEAALILGRTFRGTSTRRTRLRERLETP